VFWTEVKGRMIKIIKSKMIRAILPTNVNAQLGEFFILRITGILNIVLNGL
jgi:hypothetical protein